MEQKNTIGTERFSPDCLRLRGLPVIVLHRGLLLFHGFAKKFDVFLGKRFDRRWSFV